MLTNMEEHPGTEQDLLAARRHHSRRNDLEGFWAISCVHDARRCGYFGAMQTEPTFKTRVEGFWEWYAQRAARFYRMLEDESGGWSSSPEAAEVTNRMDEWLSFEFNRA